MTEESNRDQFPLNSFREAARHFRRPFSPAALRFKVQAVWPKENPANALVVAYVDARLIEDRLNLILPHLWHDEYEAINATHLLCKLTVDKITRQDIGEGSGKALYSDALKRAAVKFGIGVPNYAVPKMVLALADKHVQLTEVYDAKAKAKKNSLMMTAAGEKKVRQTYEIWLKEHGIRAFGEPLDHGDIVDAQGDFETEAQTESAEPARPSAERRLTGDEQARVLAELDANGKDHKVVLGSLGIDSTDELTNAHAFDIRAWLDGKKKQL